jgi:hypothetical protein
MHRWLRHFAPTVMVANENSDVILQRAAECAFPNEAMGKAILISNINWLGREGSNLRMAESKSGRTLSNSNVRSEFREGFAPNYINYLAVSSERKTFAAKVAYAIALRLIV